MEQESHCTVTPVQYLVCIYHTSINTRNSSASLNMCIKRPCGLIAAVVGRREL